MYSGSVLRCCSADHDFVPAVQRRSGTIMRASQRFSTLVAATLTVVALTAACASRHPTPDTEPNPEPAPTEDDVRDVSVGYGTQAKRELSVRIRGASSLMGGGEPLWVLDNMPLNTSISGALAGLNPQDIERIDVLKDAGATAIYGSRGMYGVILIRTKRH